MVWYKYDKYSLELIGGKGRFYDDGKVVFIGDGFSSIKMFVNASGNDPKVRKRFKSQLQMRESPRFRDTPKVKEDT